MRMRFGRWSFMLAILTIALSVAAVLILPARAQQPAGSAALTLEQLEADRKSTRLNSSHT